MRIPFNWTNIRSSLSEHLISQQSASVLNLLYYRLLTRKYLILSRLLSCSCICWMVLLAHHHPDWLVQVTVARDTFGAQRPAVIAVDVVVSGAVSTIPHVKSLIRATVIF